MSQVRAEATTSGAAEDRDRDGIMHAMPQFGQVAHYGTATAAASLPVDARRLNPKAAAGLPRFPLSPDGKVLLKAMPRSLMQEWVAELKEKPGVRVCRRHRRRRKRSFDT